MADDTTPEDSPATEATAAAPVDPLRPSTGPELTGAAAPTSAGRRATAPAGAPPPVEPPPDAEAVAPVDVVRDAMAELERSLDVVRQPADDATDVTADAPDDSVGGPGDEPVELDAPVDPEAADEDESDGTESDETADEEAGEAAPGDGTDGGTGDETGEAGESLDADAADALDAAGQRSPSVVTSLLFQPPSSGGNADPAGRRSRRAVAPAGPAQAALFAPPAEREAGAAGAADLDDPDGPSTRGDRPGDGGTAPATGSGDGGDDVSDDTADDDTSDVGDDTGDAGDESGERRRRRRGGRGRRRRRSSEGSGDEDLTADPDGQDQDDQADAPDGDASPAEDEDTEAAGAVDDDGLSRSARRRRRRRRRSGGTDEADAAETGRSAPTEDVTAVRGSTRLEAKRQRRREGRDSTRRRSVITEAEFLARRESVERSLLVRERDGRTQVAVLEDGVLVEHYVSLASNQSMIGNVYLGKVQNVLPSMEAAFVDIGRGRNAVLYAGEVNWDVVGLTSKQDRRIEAALKPGDSVLVQVTKDPIGHKGARLTAQVSLPGRFLVLVPGGSMTGISRKLPDTERTRLKRVLKRVLPEDAGVIVRTAAEGAAEEDLERDVARLVAQWEDITRKSTSASPPSLLYAEPDLAIRVVRDVFNEDIASLVVSGDDVADTLEAYVGHIAPDLAARISRWQPAPDGPADLFAAHRVDEQIAKALERKVWLPSGGSLVIDRTEAMTVIDVNTGKFTGSGGDLEETVTRNNLEAAEEIVRQLRLRDLGGIVVVDFIDMVLESNRQLVLRRLVECLGRDRTKHQVAEVTSLGLVQMTRKRVGQGLLEAFSTTCETCGGRGVLVHENPVEGRATPDNGGSTGRARSRRGSRVDQPA